MKFYTSVVLALALLGAASSYATCDCPHCPNSCTSSSCKCNPCTCDSCPCQNN